MVAIGNHLVICCSTSTAPSSLCRSRSWSSRFASSSAICPVVLIVMAVACCNLSRSCSVRICSCCSLDCSAFFRLSSCCWSSSNVGSVSGSVSMLKNLYAMIYMCYSDWGAKCLLVWRGSHFESGSSFLYLVATPVIPLVGLFNLVTLGNAFRAGNISSHKSCSAR